MSPPQITKPFARGNEHPYYLRHSTEFLEPFVNSVRCGPESISYLGPKIWGMVPHIYKNTDTFHADFVRFFVKNIGFCEIS